MCIGSNSVNQAQDLISVTKFEDFPNSLLPITYASIALSQGTVKFCEVPLTALLPITVARTWKIVASYNGCMWGIEGNDQITCKLGADISSILPGNDVTLSDENGQFKSFSLQDKPSSFLVMHAGWVVYEKPNFKGKCLYFYDGDCYSNDPENKKGPKLKMWQVNC